MTFFLISLNQYKILFNGISHHIHKIFIKNAFSFVFNAHQFNNVNNAKMEKFFQKINHNVLMILLQTNFYPKFI